MCYANRLADCYSMVSLQMNLLVTFTAVYCIGSVGATPIAPTAAAIAPLGTFSPYYAGRYPVAPGYSPYYNPASATAPILSYSNNHGIDGSYSYRLAHFHTYLLS